MKRWLLPVFVAVILGLAGGELLSRWWAFRDLAGRVTGRGRLVTIVNGKAIYETDLGGEEEVSESDAVAAQNLQHAAANESLDPARVDYELALLRTEFGDEKKFRAALRSAGLSEFALRETIEVQLRGLAWLEKHMTTGNIVSEQECRRFYQAHPNLFTQPVRYRVTHLFLAAHAETPPEVVKEKEKAIAALATRLGQGEALSQVAAEASEDEATKPRGGDLGYFSETRVLPEFIAEIQKLRVGEISQPFRTHLGFHIAQLTDTKPARLLSFEEARPEIVGALANDRREAQAVAAMRRLSERHRRGSIFSLGHRPRNCDVEKGQALKARFISRHGR
jgi:foldase protein PrsA